MRRWGVLLVCVLAASCAPEADERPPTAEPAVATVEPTATAPAASPTDSPAAVPGRLMLSERDDGRTFEVGSDTHITLGLSDDHVWEHPTVEGDSVVLSEVVFEQPTGHRLWEVEVRGPGRSVIRAEGSPNRPGEPSDETKSVRIVLVVV